MINNDTIRAYEPKGEAYKIPQPLETIPQEQIVKMHGDSTFDDTKEDGIILLSGKQGKDSQKHGANTSSEGAIEISQNELPKQRRHSNESVDTLSIALDETSVAE